MDATGERRITDHTAVDYQPAWSPDGGRIAFWTSRDGNDEVYVMSADGTNPRNVTSNAARDFVLGWTPDGTGLLFRSTRDRAMFDIYHVRVNGMEVTRVTTTVSGR
jgi:TolB protein